MNRLKVIKEYLEKSHLYFFILTVLTLVCSIIFADKIYDPILDIGREIWFPAEILNGKVLYRDIFNLFGPFSYLCNALIFKIFGTNLHTFYGIGCTLAVLAIAGIYKLAELFVNKHTAFLICLFSISCCVTTILSFSFVHAYTFAIVYGIIAFIYSVYFYTKKKSFLAALTGGIALCCKYEFIFYAVFLLICIILNSNKNIKKILASLFLMMLPCIICFGYLFKNGLTFADIFNHIHLIKTLIVTPAYKMLYTTVGTLFSIDNINKSLLYFENILLAVMGIYFGTNLIKEHKYLGSALIIFAGHYMFRYATDVNFDKHLCFLPIITLILFIAEYKNLDNKARFLCFTAIISSLKVFWYLNIIWNGIYHISVLLIAIFTLIKSDKIRNIAAIFLIILTINIFNLKNFSLYQANHEIKSDLGQIYTTSETAIKTKKLINFIKENTKSDDTIIIYPEGLILNFLTQRPSDDKYYALTPAYLQMWGEDNIIKYFSNNKNKPEYFVITNERMNMYGYNYICRNYAFEFCLFIENNYKKVVEYRVNQFDKEPFIIYKKIN